VFVANAHADTSVERMYVFDCGHASTPDVSFNWSPGVNVGEPRDFSNNCYLIRHAKGLMLWDSGMADSIADKPEGLTVLGGMLTLKVSKTLASQMAGLGVSPGDVTHIAFSHFHGDHVGNANLFTSASFYIQQADYDVVFGDDAAKYGFNTAFYEKLRNNPTTKLHGDHDVFDDGSVVILSTPGHTPGHQSLLVRLPKRGPVILSGDMVHFEENWIARRVPAKNFDHQQTVTSMERVAKILRREQAQLWINHDTKQSERIPHAPACVE
jgi:glyoxylase-like metal-dependent hydrolase (beta-lactamase superfamily II)